MKEHPFTFTVVHPITYFSSWAGKDEEWVREQYPNQLERLSTFAEQVMERNGLLICVRQLILHEGVTIGSLNILDHLTSHNLKASDLSCLVDDHSNLKKYHTLDGGVPLDVRARSLLGNLPEHFPSLLFVDDYEREFSSLGNIPHYVAGGVFDACIVNWGNVLKKTFPNVSLYYIDDLCITGNAQEREHALELVPQTSGGVISLNSIDLNRLS